MFYVYALVSQKDRKLYVGYTEDLRKRISEHNRGKVTSNRYRVPFKLIYYEACRNKADALHRERYLKTAYGKRYLKNRLKNDMSV